MKAWISTSAAACIFLLLSACAGTGEESGKTTLVFKHGKLSGDPRVVRDILQGFERTHPGVTIQEELLPASTDQQHQFYAINLEGRDVPFDLMAVDVIWVQEFARAGWVRPFGSDSADDRAAHFPAAIQAATLDGRLYALPWYVDAGVLYYRRDLLDRYGFAVPTTWPELAHMTRTVLDGERHLTQQGRALHGFVWPGKQSEGLVCVALEFIWGHGGDLVEPEAAPAMAFMRQLVADGVSPTLIATSDEEGARLLFGDGRAVFMRNWPYAWKFLQQDASAVQGKVGMAPIPSFPGHRSVSTLGGWMLAVPARALHGTLAAELATFLTSAEVQRRMTRDLGYSPSRYGLYADPDVRTAQPELADLLPVFLSARPRPLTPYYLTVSHTLQPEFSAIVVGRKSADAALASARRRLDHMVGRHERI